MMLKRHRQEERSTNTKGRLGCRQYW